MPCVRAPLYLLSCTSKVFTDALSAHNFSIPHRLTPLRLGLNRDCLEQISYRLLLLEPHRFEQRLQSPPSARLCFFTDSSHVSPSLCGTTFSGLLAPCHFVRCLNSPYSSPLGHPIMLVLRGAFRFSACAVYVRADLVTSHSVWAPTLQLPPCVSRALSTSSLSAFCLLLMYAIAYSQ